LKRRLAHRVAAATLLIAVTAGCNKTEQTAEQRRDVARSTAEEKPAERDAITEVTPVTTRLPRATLWNKGKPREVFAAWYRLPDESLAKRRAGKEEYTAAHNRLPIGALVRVTHLANGKSVLVRITDRGITSSKVKLDLCKEAADELEMVSGIARVRMQVVAEEPSGGSVPGSQTAAPQQ
jgi:rare lipoprotein A (peptidoglycan hydrolase)